MDLDSALTGKDAEGRGAADLLRSHHREVRRLIAEYGCDGDSAHARKVVAQTLLLELELYDTIEREILYPALAQLGSVDTEPLLAAHEAVMRLAVELRDRETWDDDAERAAAELWRLVEAHMNAEQETVFPRLESAGAAWLSEVGDAIVRRKEDLTRSTAEFENPAT